MIHDPRLLVADLSSLMRAAGCRLSSYGGPVGGAYTAHFYDQAGGEQEYTVPGYTGLQAGFLAWLDRMGLVVPTFADVQIATLAGTIASLNQRTDEDRRRFDSLVAVASAAIAGTLTEQPPCVKVWRFDDAPEAFRALSVHGGDEDWLALVPPDFGWVGWLASGGSFGCCSVSEHALPNGWTVHIGAHA